MDPKTKFLHLVESIKAIPTRWFFVFGSVGFALAAAVAVTYSIVEFQNATIREAEQEKLVQLERQLASAKASASGLQRVHARILELQPVLEAIETTETQISSHQQSLMELDEAEQKALVNLKAAKASQKKTLEKQLAKARELGDSQKRSLRSKIEELTAKLNELKQKHLAIYRALLADANLPPQSAKTREVGTETSEGRAIPTGSEGTSKRNEEIQKTEE